MLGSLSAVLFSAVNIQQNLINILSTILIYDLNGQTGEKNQIFHVYPLMIKKWARLGLFFIYFVFVKQTFSQQINAKNDHPLER